MNTKYIINLILFGLGFMFIFCPYLQAKEIYYDLNEPNNSINEASEIELGWIIEASFSSPDDVDWYRLSLPVKGYLEIETSSSGEEQAVKVSIHDQKGKKIARRTAKIEEQGEFLIRLKPAEDTPFSYQMRTVFLDTHIDANEPNNIAAEATKISLAEQTKSAGLSIFIFPEGDEDYFVVELKKEGYLLLDEFLGEENHLQISAGNDPDYLQEIYSSAIKVRPGRLFLRFAGEPSIQPYNVFIHFVEEMDLAEPNDTQETACLIGLEEPIPISLFPADDIDWFKLKIDKPGIIAISLLNAPDAKFDSEGNLIAGLKLSVEMAGGANNGNPPLVRTTPQNIFIDAKEAGTYTFSLSGEWVNTNPVRSINILPRLLTDKTQNIKDSQLLIIGLGIEPDDTAHLELPLIAQTKEGSFRQEDNLDEALEEFLYK